LLWLFTCQAKTLAPVKDENIYCKDVESLSWEKAEILTWQKTPLRITEIKSF